MISKSDITDKIKKLPHEIKKLIETRIELFAIEFGYQVSKILSELFYRISGVIILALGLVFLLQGLALYVGELVNDQVLGYVIVSSPIVLVGLLFIMLRPKFMVRKTREKMTRQILNSISKEEKETNDG